jgi:mono/diheme cytochrome c family protein
VLRTLSLGDRAIVISVSAIAIGALLPVAAAAQASPRAQRGLTYALANCARCHSTDMAGPSPLAIAPPFRDLRLRYPVESLRASLAQGIRTDHQNMPEFRLDPGQIDDLLAYLKTLER